MAIGDFLGSMGRTRREAKAARDSVKRQMAYEAEQRARRSQQEAAEVNRVRVLTGDLKHRYVVIEALQGFGWYMAEPGRDYDPTEAARRAAHQLRRQAVQLGADAVIHATYQIIRTVEQQGQGHRRSLLPAYEAHAFGTAIRIVGPPADWDTAYGSGVQDYNP